MFDLLSCPFCGGDADFVQTAYGTESQCACLSFEIACRKCKAKAPGAHGKILLKLAISGALDMRCDDRKAAADAWNRRVHED